MVDALPDHGAAGGVGFAVPEADDGGFPIQTEDGQFHLVGAVGAEVDIPEEDPAAAGAGGGNTPLVAVADLAEGSVIPSGIHELIGVLVQLSQAPDIQFQAGDDLRVAAAVVHHGTHTHRAVTQGFHHQAVAVGVHPGIGDRIAAFIGELPLDGFPVGSFRQAQGQDPGGGMFSIQEGTVGRKDHLAYRHPDRVRGGGQRRQTAAGRTFEGFCPQHQGGRAQARCTGFHRHLPVTSAACHNGKQLAGKQAAAVGLVLVRVGAVTVVQPHQHARAVHPHGDAVVGVFHRVAAGIHRRDGDEGQLTAVSRKFGAVGLQADHGAVTEGMVGVFGHRVPCLVVGNRPHGAGHIGGLPGSSAALVRVDDLAAQAFAVHEQFHTVSVGAGAQVDDLPGVEVPVGQQMHHGMGHGVQPGGLAGVEGILGEACRVDHAEIAVAGMVGGGFPDVVKAGPQILPQGIRVGAFGSQADVQAFRAPTGAAVAQAGTLQVIVGQKRLGQREMVDAPALDHRSGLAAVDDPIGMGGVMVVIHPLTVVIAHHLDDVGTGLGVGPGQIVGTEGGDAVAGGVVLRRFSQQHPHGVGAFGACVGIVDLVADAPEQKAGMVAVPAQPGGHIPGLPFVKEAGVVVGVFGAAPAVEGFRIDENAHLISQVHQFGRGDGMAGADGVDSHLPQQFQLPGGGVPLKGGAQASQVVVHAHPAQIQVPVVQAKPFFGREFHSAAAETGLQPVFFCPVEDSFHPVQVGSVQVPQCRVLKGKFRFGPADRGFSAGAPGFDGFLGLPGRIFQGMAVQQASVGGQQPQFQTAAGRLPFAAADFGRYLHPPGPVLPFPGGHIQAVGHQVHGGQIPQFCAPEQPRAGIPAGVGMPQFAADQHFIAERVQMRGDVQPEGGIPVFPLPGLPAVDKHGGVHIRTAEPQRYALAVSRGTDEMFAVIQSAVPVQVIRVTDLCVVGQINRGKSRWRRRHRAVGFGGGKQPVQAEIFTLHVGPFCFFPGKARGGRPPPWRWSASGKPSRSAFPEAMPAGAGLMLFGIRRLCWPDRFRYLKTCRMLAERLFALPVPQRQRLA